MSFLRRLFGGGPTALSGQAQESASVLWIYVECDKCRERLRVRVNKLNDLSLAEDISDEGVDEEQALPASGYVLRKEILGNACPRLIEVRASFDERRRLLEISARGGRLLTPEEYAAPGA